MALTKIYPIKINNIWTEISFHIHLENKQRCVYQKGEKCGEIAKVNFSKITEFAHQASSTERAYSEHSIAIHSTSMMGYVTAIMAVGPQRTPSLGGEQFL